MDARAVLAATDGSPLSLAAVNWAAEEAVRRGTVLRLVHVWPQPVGIYLEQLQAEGSALLAKVEADVAQQHPRLTVETLLLGTSTVEGLLEAARDADLLVLGTRGLGGFPALLLGSVSLAVAGSSPIPAVVLRTDLQDGQPIPAHRPGDVVVGVGDGESAEEVLQFAFSRAAELGKRVVAVHGWDVPTIWASPGALVAPFDSGVLQRAAEEHLELVLGPWRQKHPQVVVEARTVIGGGARALVDASGEAELVMIGRRMRRHAAGAHLGPIGHAVMHHAHAPVAVIPHR
jgi:nucleotide-binding universal stress UspA family protein